MNKMQKISQTAMKNRFINSPVSPRRQPPSMSQNTPINIENQPVSIKNGGPAKYRKTHFHPQKIKDTILKKISQHHMPIKNVAKNYNIPLHTIYSWLYKPGIDNQLWTMKKNIRINIIRIENFLNIIIKVNKFLYEYIYLLKQQPAPNGTASSQHSTEHHNDNHRENKSTCVMCDNLNLYKHYVRHTGKTVDFSQLVTSKDYPYHLQQRYATACNLIRMLMTENDVLIRNLQRANP